MKSMISFLLLTFIVLGYVHAQSDKSQRKSPPVVTEGNIDGVAIKIDYSSPAVRGRALYGTLVPYDAVWRTGANEATKISFSQNVLINGQALAAGTYALFTIPTAGEWNLILNTEADQWGSYNYKAEKDALRVKVSPSSGNEHVESLTFKIDQNMITYQWGDLALSVKVTKA